ncbi:hypothetical protein FRB95_010075 [Tulasnella sp. JGI-2019a]|nr:hypothetical protein FRB95_010075 [Tulasnella sp. JGI-2019a]
MAQPAAEKHSRLVVFGTVSFYLVAAIAMVMAYDLLAQFLDELEADGDVLYYRNKWVLNTTTVPLFFLFVQLVIAVLLFGVLHVMGYLFKIPPMPEAALLKGIAPMVFMNVLNLNLNNFTLKYVDASFYQVARGLVLPFTVVLSSLMLHSRPSLLILCSVGIVTFGFLSGVMLDLSPTSTTTPLGVTFGILSSATTALQAVVIKRSLDVVKGNAMDLAWYNNLLSAVVMIPCVMVAGETPDITEMFFGQGKALNAFIWGSMITGVMGFLICIAGFLSIKITSPITHMISSAVRGVVQSFIAVLVFGDIITTGRASSIALILAGSIYYTWIKHKEQQARENNEIMSKLEIGAAYERLPMKDVDADVRKNEATGR